MSTVTQTADTKNRNIFTTYVMGLGGHAKWPITKFSMHC